VGIGVGSRRNAGPRGAGALLTCASERKKACPPHTWASAPSCPVCAYYIDSNSLRPSSTSCSIFFLCHGPCACASARPAWRCAGAPACAAGGDSRRQVGALPPRVAVCLVLGGEHKALQGGQGEQAGEAEGVEWYARSGRKREERRVAASDQEAAGSTQQANSSPATYRQLSRNNQTTRGNNGTDPGAHRRRWSQQHFRQCHPVRRIITAQQGLQV
jgi:hypothetical protein